MIDAAERWEPQAGRDDSLEATSGNTGIGLALAAAIRAIAASSS
jgi:cysteine synthase